MTPECHVCEQIVGDRGGHCSSGALPPATDLFVKSSGAMTVPVAGPFSAASAAPLGGSMVGGADQTAAAPSVMAQLFTVPGRASRPQAVPPRPGVRETDVRDADQVVVTIRRLVVDILEVDAAAGDALVVGPASQLDHDVKLDGAELVALGERLGATYGPEVDVIGWFGELDIDDLAALTVGDVADYVTWCLAS